MLWSWPTSVALKSRRSVRTIFPVGCASANGTVDSRAAVSRQIKMFLVMDFILFYCQLLSTRRSLYDSVPSRPHHLQDASLAGYTLGMKTAISIPDKVFAE